MAETKSKDEIVATSRRSKARNPRLEMLCIAVIGLLAAMAHHVLVSSTGEFNVYLVVAMGAATTGGTIGFLLPQRYLDQIVSESSEFSLVLLLLGLAAVFGGLCFAYWYNQRASLTVF